MAKRHGLIEAGDGEDFREIAEALSVAKRHGLIEANCSGIIFCPPNALSVAKRHGLIEAGATGNQINIGTGYPWQNATASLKPTIPRTK